VQRFSTFDGINIAFDVLGEGPPVLLHHGFASESQTNWVRPGVAAAIVASGRSVVLIDARGHGESDKPHDPAAYSGGSMVRDVHALLDELAIESVDVVGYSMGAFVSLSLATTESRLRALVLGGAGKGQISSRNDGRMEEIAEALEAPDKSSILSPTALAFRNFAEATGADLAALAAIQRGRPQRLDPAILAQITAPTLVVNGDRDTLVGPPESLAEAIPGARFESVPGDHLSAVVQPEFRQAIVSFLDDVALV
jgi:pimeloyl-ACP methyl ester carboxylesterase